MLDTLRRKETVAPFGRTSTMRRLRSFCLGGHPRDASGRESGSCATRTCLSGSYRSSDKRAKAQSSKTAFALPSLDLYEADSLLALDKARPVMERCCLTQRSNKATWPEVAGRFRSRSQAPAPVSSSAHASSKQGGVNNPTADSSCSGSVEAAYTRLRRQFALKCSLKM